MSPILFELCDKPAPCPSSANCRTYDEVAQGECRYGYEREAGANCCDFVAWVTPPLSTFNASTVASAFGIEADRLEEAA